jgi:hypothetical protein
VGGNPVREIRKRFESLGYRRHDAEIYGAELDVL